MLSLLKIFPVFCLACLIPGCGSDVKPEPAPPPLLINVELMTSTRINPDASGRPSPLMVRIYELKTLGAFEVADYFVLVNDDEAQLGADLVHKEEFHLRPGQTKTFRHKLAEESKYLGVMAAYRNLDRAVWKATVELPPEATKNVWIFFDELAVYLKTK